MAEEAVKIKGTRKGLVILFDPNNDIEELKNNLKIKMEKSGDFFKGAKFSVYDAMSGKDSLYIRELEEICRHYGLVPTQEALWPLDDPAQDPADQQQKNSTSRIIPFRPQFAGGEQALLLSHTLRSGQKISSPYTVVIMADVNPGAEVFSGGSVYVLGTCKGSVQAGSDGNLMSEIFAIKLQPLALRIGSISAETPPPASPEGPVLARVNRGKIVYKDTGKKK